MHFRCFRAAVLVAISVLSCFALSSAQADVIYTTFGPGNTFDTAGYEVFGASNNFARFGVPAQEVAGLFTITQSFTFDAAKAALSVSVPADPGIIMELVRDDSGHPGSVIENLGSQSLNPTATIKTYSSVAHPLLTAGTYWLVAVPVGPGTTGSWRRSAIDFAHPTSPANYFGNADLTAPSTTWTVFNDPIGNPGSSYAPAFEIDGTLVPVPAPKTVWAGAVLLVGWVVGRKLRGRGTA